MYRNGKTRHFPLLLQSLMVGTNLIKELNRLGGFFKRLILSNFLYHISHTSFQTTYPINFTIFLRENDVN